MTAFSVDTFFFGSGITRLHDAQLLADPALVAQLDLANGLAGGLTFATDDSRILIDDDVDALARQVLVELPQALRSGSGKTISLPQAGDQFEVALAGDVVTFDFGDGTVMTEPLPEVLAALDAAADRLARIRAAAGGATAA